MSDCPHLITEAGKCIDCGAENLEPFWALEDLLREETVEPPEFLWSKNLVVIAKLAEETWLQYDRLATENEDPACPQRPRLSLVGGQLMRIPFHTIWNQTLGPSFIKAKELGYRSDYPAWCEYVKDVQNYLPKT